MIKKCEPDQLTFFKNAMTDTQLWYIFIFAWGLVSAWAVIVGLEST
jgi:hypothetical protein